MNVITGSRLSDVYEVATDMSSSRLIMSEVLQFSISDDYMFAVKDHVSLPYCNFCTGARACVCMCYITCCCYYILILYL